MCGPPKGCTGGNHGGQQVKINKWTRRHADARPPEETDAGEAAEGQPPDGLSEAGVREALRDVRDPEIGRDLVSLNMVRGVSIEDGAVSVGVALTTAGFAALVSGALAGGGR